MSAFALARALATLNNYDTRGGVVLLDNRFRWHASARFRALKTRRVWDMDVVVRVVPSLNGYRSLVTIQCTNITAFVIFWQKSSTHLSTWHICSANQYKLPAIFLCYHIYKGDEEVTNLVHFVDWNVHVNYNVCAKPLNHIFRSAPN